MQNCAASDPLLATPFRTRAARQAFHFRNKSHKQVNALTISDQKQAWSARKSAELYGIDEWGSGYFGVSPEGEVVVRAPHNGAPGAAVSLMDIARGLQERGLTVGAVSNWVWNLPELLHAGLQQVSQDVRAVAAQPQQLLHAAIKVRGFLHHNPLKRRCR